MAKSMADIWKMLEKQHGSEGLFAADSEITDLETKVISSGSHALDDALGIWGLPMGYLVQFAGAESSGKTLMSLMAIREWQMKDPRNWAMFVDAEFTFDQQWAASLGVDLSRVYLLRENRASAIFDRLLGIPTKRDKNGNIKKAKPGVLDLEIETGGTGLGIIVLDSLAHISPPAELESKAGKDNMSLLARFLPPELRKLTPLLSKTEVLFIVINQIRTKPGVMYGNPETSPGGQAIKHAEAVAVNFGMINKADTYIYDEDKEQIGHKIRAKIIKNKKAPPFRKAEVSIIYTKGVTNKGEELRDIGARYGVIERPNNKTWILDGEKYNGKEAMSKALEENEELATSVLERAKEAKRTGVKAGGLGNIDDEEGNGQELDELEESEEMENEE